MKLEHTLDDLHVALTRRWWTQMFAAFTRCLVAVAFIPPSIPKILHQPFTMLPLEKYKQRKTMVVYVTPLLMYR